MEDKDYRTTVVLAGTEEDAADRIYETFLFYIRKKKRTLTIIRQK